jgi:hypothetical protein
MYNIPEFPQFRKITLDDKKWYDTFFHDFPPYADFSFGDLVIWYDQNDDLEISIHNTNLVFQFTNLLWNNERVINFLGNSDPQKTIEAIFDYQKSQHLPQRLRGVPEFVIQDLHKRNNTSFFIEAERDQDEYIVDAQKIANLEIHKIRDSVRRFQKINGECKLVQINLFDQHDTDLVRKNSHVWFAVSRNETAQQEQSIFDRVLKYGYRLDHRCIGFFVEGQLIGVIVYQMYSQENTAVINHIKNNGSYPESFTYMLWACADFLAKQGITQINAEQDLGIPGIRYYKEHLEPLYLLKKFSITLKS